MLVDIFVKKLVYNFCRFHQKIFKMTLISKLQSPQLSIKLYCNLHTIKLLANVCMHVHLCVYVIMCTIKTHKHIIYDVPTQVSLLTIPHSIEIT